MTPAEIMAVPKARPVWSQPPPGLAGMTMRSLAASLLAALGLPGAAGLAVWLQAGSTAPERAAAVSPVMMRRRWNWVMEGTRLGALGRSEERRVGKECR